MNNQKAIIYIKEFTFKEYLKLLLCNELWGGEHTFI